MPPKKVSGAAAYQGKNEPKKNQPKKLEELEKENKSLKLHVAQLEENFDYRKICTKLNFTEENMITLMQDENAKMRARICELELSQISSDIKEGANNKSDALKKLEDQLLEKDRDIKEIQRIERNLIIEIEDCTKQLDEKNLKVKQLKKDVEKAKKAENNTKMKKENTAENIEREELCELKTKVESIRKENVCLKTQFDEAHNKIADLKTNQPSRADEQTTEETSKETTGESKNKEICTRLNITEVNLNVLMQDENAKLRTRINELESSQSSRLSKAMELTENNPDIADLSDFNRPTKLAERYSELYDNEWTDAFEELENNGMESRQILDELYNILKDVYIFSKKVSHDYDRNVSSSALTIPGATEEKPKTQNLNLSTRKQLVYIKKTLAPLLADDVFKLYLKQCKDVNGPITQKFIGVCTEICWLMSVHDPPVVLDLEEPNGRFDNDRYRYYQRSGKQVDFIVWPPMKLHEKGPLLAKGVAEGK